MHGRFIAKRLVRRASGPDGRLTLLTGPRDAGKTTLARAGFPDRALLELSDPVRRSELGRRSPPEWRDRTPHALVDELHRNPDLAATLLETVGRHPETAYLALADCRLQAFPKLAAALRGKAAVEELWPLTLPELVSTGWDDEPRESPLVAGLRRGAMALPSDQPAEQAGFGANAGALEALLAWGGFPAVHDPWLDEAEKAGWLTRRHAGFLERDLPVVASPRDLDPFLRTMQAAAEVAGELVNFSDLARAAEVSPPTVRRFLKHLQLAYQTLLLPAWSRNRSKRLVQMPRLHFVDVGGWRAVSGRLGPLDATRFASAIVLEILKQVRAAALPIAFFHLASHDGRAFDLLLDLGPAYVALAIRRTPKVADADARPLRGLEAILDKPLAAAILLSLDRDARPLSGGVLALPIAWALGPAPVSDMPRTTPTPD